MRIAVFCSSTNECNPIFYQAAQEVGQWIAENGHTLVFGGSNTGLMGAVSTAASKGGAQIIGVVPDIPQILKRKSDILTETVYSSSMADRKDKMIALSDAFIVLPGGPGTLDELGDILCLKSLHRIESPIVLYDANNFYGHFVELLNVMVENNVALPSIHQCYSSVHSPKGLSRILSV